MPKILLKRGSEKDITSTNLDVGEVVVAYNEDRTQASLYTGSEDGSNFKLSLKGDTPTVEVGNVNTVEPGTPASVTATNTETGVKLNFNIPKGDVGGGGSSNSIVDMLHLTRNKLPTEMDIFTDGNCFKDDGHCSNIEIMDPMWESYTRISSDSRAQDVQNGKAHVIFNKDFTSTTTGKIKIEFDHRIPAETRWTIAVVDFNKRGSGNEYNPGYGDTFDTNGVIMWQGVDNSTLMYKINGRNSGYNRNNEPIGNLGDKWIHTELTYYIKEKYVEWTISTSEDGTIDTYSGTANMDASAIPNGIELHTWTETYIDVQTVSIVYKPPMPQNRIYITSNGTPYIYFNNTPVQIGGKTESIDTAVIDGGEWS